MKNIEMTLDDLNFILNLNRDNISNEKIHKKYFLEFQKYPLIKEMPVYDFSFVEISDYEYRYK